MKLLAIVNGASAGGKTAKRWPEIEAALTGAGVEFDVAFTEAPGHAAELTIEALGRGREIVAACGGDGTLSEVVNGLVDERGAPRAAGTKLAIIPSGTGGDFRKTLGIGADARSAAELIAADRTRKIDAGLIEYADGTAARRFINIASCGVGYEVDRRINNLKFKPGKLAYALVSAYSIISYGSVRARITVDGAAAEGSFSSVALANGRCFGGGMKIAPRAEPDDGLFDVILTSTSRTKAILGAKRLYAGTHLESPGSIMLRGSEIEIEPHPDAQMGFDVDGEALGFAPARINALPGVLDVIC